ncbi:hypothetical protein BGX33_009476 [Mortierella sp. NVP41]|nr:hypothetical protein BGX33_009476 [Mortierella sp. NVP41]
MTTATGGTGVGGSIRGSGAGSTGGGGTGSVVGGVGRRRKRKEKEGGGVGRKRTDSAHGRQHVDQHYNNNGTQGNWMAPGDEGESEGYQGEGYQGGTGRSCVGGGGGGGRVFDYAGVQPVEGCGSTPSLQCHHPHRYQDQIHQEHGSPQGYQQHQGYQDQPCDINEDQPGHRHGHQQQEGESSSDKTIRSSFLQGIKSHALQPAQLTHLTLLRYEFLMNEFVEMMRLLPALQVLDIDVVSVPACSCRTIRLHPQHPQKHQYQAQNPLFSSQEQQHHSRARPYTETPYSWQSQVDNDGDEMDVDYEEGSPAGSTATLCNTCIRSQGLLNRSQGAAAIGTQDQFLSVRSLTFRGTAIVPELLALFPNLETLAFEEMRYQTLTINGPPSVPGDALFHGSIHSRAHSRMSSSQGEFDSSSFYTDSGDDSLDATASLSLEAGLPSPPSRQSVMLSELATMLKNHCSRLVRLVLNEPLLVEDMSRGQQQLQQQQQLSSSTVGPSSSPGSGQGHFYSAGQPWTGRGQDHLALLLQAVPRLKQFVAHSRVVAKCPRLLETLLEYHHPHLCSFQVLDDSQDMSHYPPIQTPNAPAMFPNRPQHHAFYSTQEIYSQQSPHQQQQHQQQQPGYQYHSAFVPYGSESPTMQQHSYWEEGADGGYADPSCSPSAQPSKLLHQALQMQHQMQQLERQQTMMCLQTACLRILESCPNLQVFESKIPLPLQDLIGSVPRWACGSEITVLWLEIQELTGNSGLDPEEEEVMQMFVKSLFKGSRSNTSSSSSPHESSGSSSRPTSISPSPPPPVPPVPVAEIEIVSDGSSPCAVEKTGFGSHPGVVERPRGSGTESSVKSVETFESPSPPSFVGMPSIVHHPPPRGLSSDAWTSERHSISTAAAGSGGPAWNKPLLPPPPPLAYASPAAISSTMESYPSGYQIEGIERLVALQFLVEHQLVYLPKLDRFLMGNHMYTIPTRERV